MSQFHDVDQADIALSALDSADVVSMQVRAICQFLLVSPRSSRNWRKRLPKTALGSVEIATNS